MMTGETILVVEDEAIIALHLQRMLTSFGYRVPQTAATGMAAIRAVERVRPDLILMDIKLQGSLNGIDTAHQIRMHYDLPIVYLTAFVEDVRLLEACETEPYGYLTKPVQERELHTTLAMALYKYRMDQRIKESESLYREMYHNTPAMLQATDPQGVITQISDYWLSAFGYEREEVIGRPTSDFLTPASANDAARFYEVFDETGIVRDIEVQMLRKNGEVVDILLSIQGTYDDQGQLISMLSAMVDITARKQVEAAEHDQRALAEALRDSAAALNTTLSLDEVLENILANVGRVVPHKAVNIMLVEEGLAWMARFKGYHELDREDAVPAARLPVREQVHLRLMEETHCPLVFADTRKVATWAEPWIASYVGAPIIFKEHLIGFINLIGVEPNFFTQEHANRLLAFANQAAIAIENARLHAEVTRLATMDEMTGIYNRRRLFELGQREFERACRYSSLLSVILMDIDHFKKVNDSFGHYAGDRVLMNIAALIRRSVREVDLSGRYGGEEFVIILPETAPEKARDVAERLRKSVSELILETERGPLAVTISVGIAGYDIHLPSLAALIDQADQAMYSAKQAGRNRVEIFRQGS